MQRYAQTNKCRRIRCYPRNRLIIKSKVQAPSLWCGRLARSYPSSCSRPRLRCSDARSLARSFAVRKSLKKGAVLVSSASASAGSSPLHSLSFMPSPLVSRSLHSNTPNQTPNATTKPITLLSRTLTPPFPSASSCPSKPVYTCPSPPPVPPPFPPPSVGVVALIRRGLCAPHGCSARQLSAQMLSLPQPLTHWSCQVLQMW